MKIVITYDVQEQKMIRDIKGTIKSNLEDIEDLESIYDSYMDIGKATHDLIRIDRAPRVAVIELDKRFTKIMLSYMGEIFEISFKFGKSFFNIVSKYVQKLTRLISSLDEEEKGE